MLLKKLMTVILVIGIFNINDIYAQVKEVTLGVDGFTCSLCAKGVEGQLRSLNFVKSINANLKNATFKIAIKDDTMINLGQLRTAVTNGGFTLRSVELVATGFINESGSGYTISTGNTPVINLNNVTTKFNIGDQVQVFGTLNLSNNTLSVSSIEKL